MARVKTVKFEFGGKECQFHINVGKDGVFKAHIPREVYAPLGLKSSVLSGKCLDDVDGVFHRALYEYNEARKEYTLAIFVRANLAGKYKPRGWSMNRSFSDEGIGLSWDLVFIEHKAGTSEEDDVYYPARKIGPSPSGIRKQIDRGHGYELGAALYGRPKGAMIPYSEQALKTLEDTDAVLIQLAESIANVLSLDKDELANVLSSPDKSILKLNEGHE